MSLYSEASSRIIFSLLLGISNPKAIADRIGNTAASVVEQLNKLREEGCVKRVEKEGKIQPYEIDWDNLIKAAILASPLLMDAGVMFTITGKGPDWEQITRTLSGNIHLRSFLKKYFEAVAKREEEVDIYMTYEYRGGHGKVGRTIYKIMQDFEVTLLHNFSRLDREKMDAMGELDLYEGLKLWYEFCQEALNHHLAKPFQQALDETLSLPS